ncbi:MAG TPA: DUF192 domain-containing protein [Thermoanaerobaculia bacterium]|jgi:uncharacterized membrane protein (UPF0127 family)|nr:DUF192 domain-containing protein [Thermoanaerobaculia bacterium]
MAVHRLDRVERAETIGRRFFGLMGRRDLGDVRLWFPRCRSVHTCFMRGSIDVVFLDANNTVVELHSGVRPWRLLNARGRVVQSTLELSTGGIRTLALEVGDEVRWA